MDDGGALPGILTGNFVLLQLLSAVMTTYGPYVCYLMLRRPDDLASKRTMCHGPTCIG